MNESQHSAADDETSAAWQPLTAFDRRVVGVLIEKAKTTPEQYPLTINAVRVGSNQKSNRHPVVAYEADDVQDSLDRLRGMGAVVEVFGSGRTARYRHAMYEWLGVDKVELAIVAELLLRGPQTVGELRGRAARMEKIADVAALRPLLASLKEKGLVVSLTPDGRGHVVTHGLYPPEEMAAVRRKYAGAEFASAPSGGAQPAAPTARSVDAGAKAVDTTAAERISPAPAATAGLVAEVSEMKSQIATLRDQLAEHENEIARLERLVQQIRDDLGG